MANPTVKEVLEALRQSFQGVDLRAVVVALGDQEGWLSAFTVIRFSAKTPQEISEEHEKLKNLYRLPSEVLNKRLGVEHNIEPYKGMNIELSAYAVSQFEQLVRLIPAGIINGCDRSFRVVDRDFGVALMQEEMYLQSLVYQEMSDPWPIYYWGRGTQNANFEGSPNGQGERPKLNERDLDRQARNLDFASFQDLVGRITQASFLQSSGHAFEIHAPVYARIASIAPSNDAVQVFVYFHPALGDLTVECSLCDERQGQRTPPRSLGNVRVAPQTKGQEFTQFSHEFALEKPPATGLVTASLFKRGAARIDLHQQSSPLRSGVLSFRAFTSFVPEDEVTEYLECLTSGENIAACRIWRRFTPKESSKKADELIEHVVTYLLSLCELSPILLSNPQYDVIEGGLQAGSADIFATAHSVTPILVSCTMAMSDPKKRGMLLAARTAIANRVRVPPETIRLVLVTGKPSVAPSDAEMVELAAEDLKELWAMVRQGNLFGAKRRLGLQQV